MLLHVYHVKFFPFRVLESVRLTERLINELVALAYHRLVDIGWVMGVLVTNKLEGFLALLFAMLMEL